MKIFVRVHPNSKRPRVEKDAEGVLQVYVRQPAIEGKANQAVIEALAEFLGLSKNKVLLVKGQKAKMKIVEVGSNVKKC